MKAKGKKKKKRMEGDNVGQKKEKEKGDEVKGEGEEDEEEAFDDETTGLRKMKLQWGHQNASKATFQSYYLQDDSYTQHTQSLQDSQRMRLPPG